MDQRTLNRKDWDLYLPEPPKNCEECYSVIVDLFNSLQASPHNFRCAIDFKDFPADRNRHDAFHDLVKCSWRTLIPVCPSFQKLHDIGVEECYIFIRIHDCSLPVQWQNKNVLNYFCMDARPYILQRIVSTLCEQTISPPLQNTETTSQLLPDHDAPRHRCVDIDSDDGCTDGSTALMPGMRIDTRLYTSFDYPSHDDAMKVISDINSTECKDFRVKLVTVVLRHHLPKWYKNDEALLLAFFWRCQESSICQAATGYLSKMIVKRSFDNWAIQELIKVLSYTMGALCDTKERYYFFQDNTSNSFLQSVWVITSLSGILLYKFITQTDKQIHFTQALNEVDPFSRIKFLSENCTSKDNLIMLALVTSLRTIWNGIRQKESRHAHNTVIISQLSEGRFNRTSIPQMKTLPQGEYLMIINYIKNLNFHSKDETKRQNLTKFLLECIQKKAKKKKGSDGDYRGSLIVYFIRTLIGIVEDMTGVTENDEVVTAILTGIFKAIQSLLGKNCKPGLREYLRKELSSLLCHPNGFVYKFHWKYYDRNPSHHLCKIYLDKILDSYGHIPLRIIEPAIHREKSYSSNGKHDIFVGVVLLNDKPGKLILNVDDTPGSTQVQIDIFKPGKFTTCQTVMLNELLHLTKLGTSAHTVDVLAYQVKSKPFFYTLETPSLANENMEEWLRNMRKKKNYEPEHVLLDIFHQCSEIILYCNGRRILIRDIQASSFAVFKNADGKYTVKLSSLKLAVNTGVMSIPLDGEYQDEDIMLYDANGDGRTFFNMLSPRFLAPESYENKVFTKQSEVYSLGCLGFQVFTYGACPFVELDSYGDNTIMDMVAGGYRLKQPACISRAIFCFLLDMTMAIPHEREMSSLKQYIERAKRKDTVNTEVNDLWIAMLEPMLPRQNTPKKENVKNAKEKIEYTVSKETTVVTEYVSQSRLCYAFTEVMTRLVSERKECHFTPFIEEVQQSMKIITYTMPWSLPILEYITGHGAQLKIQDIVKILQQIASGMAHLHSLEVIHCDLQPCNIFVSNYLKVTIVGLGRAKRLDDTSGILDIDRQTVFLNSKEDFSNFWWFGLETLQEGILCKGSDVFMYGVTVNQILDVFVKKKKMMSSGRRKSLLYDDGYMDMPMDRCARLEKMHPEHIYKHPYTNNEIHDQNDLREFLESGQTLHQVNCDDLPIKDGAILEYLYYIQKCCWVQERHRRKSFTQLVDDIGRLTQEHKNRSNYEELRHGVHDKLDRADNSRGYFKSGSRYLKRPFDIPNKNASCDIYSPNEYRRHISSRSSSIFLTADEESESENYEHIEDDTPIEETVQGAVANSTPYFDPGYLSLSDGHMPRYVNVPLDTTTHDNEIAYGAQNWRGNNYPIRKNNSKVRASIFVASSNNRPNEQPRLRIQDSNEIYDDAHSGDVRDVQPP